MAANQNPAADAASMFAAVTSASIRRANSARTIRGVDAVRKTRNSMKLDNALLRYRAAAILSPDEITAAIPRAASPRKNVLTKREVTSELTGTRKYIDSPRSPTTAFLSQFP